MKPRAFALIFSILLPAAAFGQLTPSQKVSDFQQIAGAYIKQYAFLDWKKTALGFDALNLAPWLDRASQSKTDIEYFEIVQEYVAKLQDSHSVFTMNSGFAADLGFIVDLYDGKPLVESIDEDILDPGALPFGIGDEVISIDGRPAAEWITELSKFIGDGNAISARRTGAYFLTYRVQAYYPRAADIGDSAKVVFKTKKGETVTAELPWVKYGIPYVSGAPLPDPSADAKPASVREAAVAPWRKTLEALRTLRVRNRQFGTRQFFSGTADLNPVFKPGDDFVQHSGNRRFDSVFSGVFKSGAYRIGFLRIPSFSGLTFGGTLDQDILDELTFLADTDGLVVDLMRNPGGSGCAAEALASALFTTPFTSLSLQKRVTWNDVRSLSDELDLAILFEEDEEIIEQIRALLNNYLEAYQSNKNFTAPMPICGDSTTVQPLKDRRGRTIGYKNPVMVLTDELTASAAELMAAILQDNGRAVVYGTRTNGAGGAVVGTYGGIYGDMSGSVTVGQLQRSKPASVQGLPAAPLIENIGVQANLIDDYMKAENLNNGGKPFVDRMLKAMADYIKSKQTTGAAQ